MAGFKPLNDASTPLVTQFDRRQRGYLSLVLFPAGSKDQKIIRSRSGRVHSGNSSVFVDLFKKDPEGDLLLAPMSFRPRFGSTSLVENHGLIPAEDWLYHAGKKSWRRVRWRLLGDIPIWLGPCSAKVAQQTATRPLTASGTWPESDPQPPPAMNSP